MTHHQRQQADTLLPYRAFLLLEAIRDSLSTAEVFVKADTRTVFDIAVHPDPCFLLY